MAKRMETIRIQKKKKKKKKKKKWIGDEYEAFDWGVAYDKSKFTFTGKTTNQVIHIDFIAQEAPSKNAWSTFIIDEAKGFTKAGVESINESIRTYSWAILGSQPQTKTDILGTGTAFDAQK